MDPIVHFELPADDLARARTFYATAFGWTATPYGDDYAIVVTTPVEANQRPTTPGAINGGLSKRGGPVRHPAVVVGVADVDAALKRVAGAGGKLVQPKQPVGDMGFLAYFEDPEGNVVGLWQPAER